MRRCRLALVASVCALLASRPPAAKWSDAPSRDVAFSMYRRHVGAVAASTATVARATYPAPREDMDFSSLGFGLTTRDTKMAVAKCKRGDKWAGFEVTPYGAMSMEPAATALNYGQALFEGLKAYRTSKGRIVVFRPQENAKRMAGGAERFLIPPVPEKLFLDMLGSVVRENADWVPPEGQGELYLRPLLLGSGGQLGVGPSSEFTFVIYAAPVGKYFKGGAKGGARMRLEKQHHRAAPLGTGWVKAAGNYAPCFQAQANAKADGFGDVIYLDVSATNIEEAAASNFFCVTKDGVVKTPPLGTILAGVTRKSVLTLGNDLAKQGNSLIAGAKEESITVDDVAKASEAFVCGTGAGLTPIEEIHKVGTFDCPGKVTQELQKALAAVKMESDDALDGYSDWLWDPWTNTAA